MSMCELPAEHGNGGVHEPVTREDLGGLVFRAKNWQQLVNFGKVSSSNFCRRNYQNLRVESKIEFTLQMEGNLVRLARHRSGTAPPWRRRQQQAFNDQSRFQLRHRCIRLVKGDTAHVLFGVFRRQPLSNHRARFDKITSPHDFLEGARSLNHHFS